MPKIRCTCGARFSFAEKSIGKKGKCARCGEILTLQPEDDDSGIIAFADEPDDGGDTSHDSGQPRFDARPPAAPPHFPSEVVIDAPEIERPPADFASKLLDTILFIKEPHNFVVYLMLAFLLCLAEIVLPFGSIFGAIGRIVILGWFCAYRFDLIGCAAAGDERIPSLTAAGNRWDGILQPIVRWFGSWIVVLLPAAVIGQIYGMRQVMDTVVPVPTSGMLFIPNFFAIPVIGQLLRFLVLFAMGPKAIIEALYNGGYEPIAVAIVMGLFFWPMVALCVSLGGFVSLLRFDLIIKTVLVTLPSYLLTLAVVYGTIAFVNALGKFLPASFGAAVITVAVSVYLQIVAMRTIGLHYYFFKRRYAWSWG